jgi:NADH-quinone oxidoreductase subunit H
VEDRTRDARAALDFLGMEVDLSDGVRVTSVRAGGPADRAGVQPLDRILSFEGVSASTDLDLVPSGTERSPIVVLERGETRLDKAVDIEGYKSDTTRDLVAPVLVLGSLLLVFLVLGTRAARVLSWLERRVERGALRHKRDQGGLVARISGFLSSVVQDRPGKAPSGALALAAPFLVFVAVSATFAFVPYVELHHRAELDVGVLYLLSVTSFTTIALVTGGHDAEGKWTLGVSLRAFVRALACELPAALSIGAVVLTVGSLRLRDIALHQIGSGGSALETGGWPWFFLGVRSPQLFVLFLLFFVTVLVEPGRPRALRGADDGASSAPSFRRTAFFFAEWMNVFVMCALASALFFGGWYVPGIAASEHESNPAIGFLGTALYLVKSWLLVGLVMTKRVSLPRVRSDVLFGLGLRYGLPACVVAVGATVLESLYPPVPTVSLMVSGVTLLVVGAVAVLFVWSVVTSDGPARTRTTSNAIL